MSSSHIRDQEICNKTSRVDIYNHRLATPRRLIDDSVQGSYKRLNQRDVQGLTRTQYVAPLYRKHNVQQNKDIYLYAINPQKFSKCVKDDRKGTCKVVQYNERSVTNL